MYRQTQGMGNIHVQLVPTYQQSSVIRYQLAELQREVGGELTVPLHLTLQSFRAPPQQLKLLEAAFGDLTRTTQPVQVKSSHLELSRGDLVCHVVPEGTMTQFFMAVKRLLLGARLEPLIDKPPRHIKLLSEVKAEQLKTSDYRRTLFTGQRLVLSQARAPGRYSALFSSPFAEVTASTLPAPDLFLNI